MSWYLHPYIQANLTFVGCTCLASFFSARRHGQEGCDCWWWTGTLTTLERLRGADKPDKHSKEQAPTCPDLTTPHDCWIWIRCWYRYFSIFIWWFNSPFVVGTKSFTSFVQSNPPSLPRPVSPQHASYWSVAVVSLSWRLGRRRSLKWV